MCEIFCEQLARAFPNKFVLKSGLAQICLFPRSADSLCLQNLAHNEFVTAVPESLKRRESLCTSRNSIAQTGLSGGVCPVKTGKDALTQRACFCRVQALYRTISNRFEFRVSYTQIYISKSHKGSQLIWGRVKIHKGVSGAAMWVQIARAMGRDLGGPKLKFRRA